MYCASKWALEGWAESLAYEVDPFGIDVVLIEPGPYRTEIWNSTKWVVPSDSAYLSWLQAAAPSRRPAPGQDLTRSEGGGARRGEGA